MKLSHLNIFYCLCLAGIWFGVAVSCGGGGECFFDADCRADQICILDQTKNHKICRAKYFCPDQCNEHKDCVSCMGKLLCIKGVCAAEETDNCPSLCRTDEQCANCPAGQTACVAGACSIPRPCPSACKLDSDCQPCTEGQKYCIDGACAAKPKCPASCQVDADCAHCPDQRTSCQKQTCVAPKIPDCAKDSDCAKDQLCDDGKCIPRQNCPDTCKADADCSACPAQRNFCVSNKCVIKPVCKNDGDCKQGERCEQYGQCICKADHERCGDSCVDLQNDGKHCGACNKVCSNKEICKQGKCAEEPCLSGQTNCGGTCVDLKIDQRHCGACDKACPSDKTCANGSCACGMGFIDCGGKCVDSYNDPVHCGGCNRSCDPNETCVGSQCKCKPDMSVCNSRCTDTNTDRDHCGVCNKPCPTDQSCCVGKCTDIKNDRENCGKCSNICPANQNCHDSKCDATCPAKCVRDEDCKICAGGKIRCIELTCQTSGPGQSCDNTSCPLGYICLGYTGTQKSYCTQDCTQDPKICEQNTDGRSHCVPIAKSIMGNVISGCLAQADKAEACGFAIRKQAFCKEGLYPPLHCSTKGTCEEATLQTKAGDPCNKVGDFAEPIKICDDRLSLICTSAGTCASATLANEGQECDPEAKNLGKYVICKPNSNLACITFGKDEDISHCHTLCDPNLPNQCTHRSGLSCEPLQSGNRGFCYPKTCKTNTDCIFIGYSCVKLQSGDMTCIPPIPPGPKSFGEICSTPLRTKGCQAGLYCLRLSGQTSPDGFCTRDCSYSLCTSFSSGGYIYSTWCANFTSGDKYCVIRCRLSNPLCPSGYTCDAQDSICLLP